MRKKNKTEQAQAEQIDAPKKAKNKEVVPLNQSDPPDKSLQMHQQKALKTQKTLYGSIKHRLFATRLVLSLLSMVFTTFFTIVMLRQHWGNTMLLYILLGILAVYMLLFSLIIILSVRRSKKINRSVKDYKSGLKILRALLRLISFLLSISVFGLASASQNIGTPFQVISLTLSLCWAIFQIVYQLTKIMRRHGLIKSRRS